MPPIQISLWDGVSMGAGLGISINAPIKIATETCVFAMPGNYYFQQSKTLLEAKIGLHLNIGGGYYFSRMRSHMGYYLGLTSASLRGSEVVQSGIADFYVQSEKLDKLQKEICETTRDNTTLEELKEVVQKYAEPVLGRYQHEDIINRAFGKPKIEEIYEELERERYDTAFAKRAIDMMKANSPTSMRVIFEQLNRGKQLDLEENMKMDMRSCIT